MKTKNENTIYLPELIEEWAKNSGQSRKHTKMMYDSLLTTIHRNLQNGKNVQLKNLVKLEYREMSAKCFYDVRTKQKCSTGVKTKLKAVLSKNLLNKLKQQK